MDILGQSALIVALTAFTLAITALSRNLRNKLVMSFSLLCAVISVWAFCFFLEKIFGTGTSYRAHLILNLWLAPAGLLFVRVLTRVENAFIAWLHRLSLLNAVVVTGLEFSAFKDNPIVLGLTYFAPSYLVLVCLHLMFIDWRLKRGLIRRTKISTVGLTRRYWIYVGALLLLGGAVMDHVVWLGDVIPSVANILICLYLFMVSEAVIHQRLLNVSALANKVIVLVFISICFTLIYATFVAWIENSPALFILNTFLASFIIIMLVEPFRKLTNLGVMRLFSRKYLLFENKIEDAQLQLTGVLDTVGLAQLTLQFLESTLRCECATVFVLRSDGTKYRRIRGVRDDALSNREILANHPVVEFVMRMKRRGETPIILDQYLINEIDRSTSRAQREQYDLVLKGMLALNANILIPFTDGASVLGFVALRAFDPPEPWGNNWGVLSVIYPFFQQGARTLKNMDVYVRLREKDRLAALGEMAAGLAHEIRNPLGAIKGAAQYLEPQAKDTPQSAFLSVIVDEVNRLNKVVTQFLDYSRPFATDFVQYDVGVLLERTRALFESLAHSGKKVPPLKLIAPVGGFHAIPKMWCSPEQLKQVLVNLIQNSINSLSEVDASMEPEIRIGAYAERRARDGAVEVVLFVEDNGKGIPKENLDKIFIPFFTTATASGGTGLGLSICSRIIEAHGGTIDVVSEEGKFTRFSARVPTASRV